MPFPLSEEQITKIRPKAKTFKEKSFDNFLTEIIIFRAIQRHQIRDRAKYEKISEHLLPIVRRDVDEHVLDILLSENVLEGHTGLLAKHKQMVYKAEDTIRKELRELTKFVYGNDVSRSVIRKKVIGCMVVTLDIVNSDSFKKELDHLIFKRN